MASQTTGRSLKHLLRKSRPTCQCAHAAPSRSAAAAAIRQFSTPSSRRDAQYEPERTGPARWSYTPERMRAPYPVKIVDKYRKWECNNDPERLDQFYVEFLGRGGETLLTDEVKWLAITHKSFDQGRRGFNDKLAFFGRRILNLETTLTLLHSPALMQTQGLSEPADDRVPFSDPALEGLPNVTDLPLAEVLSKAKLAQLAKQVGMPQILRWVPRMEDNLEASGIDTVLTSTVYAIIGAIGLQKGGPVAAQVARDRVLTPLGIA